MCSYLKRKPILKISKGEITKEVKYTTSMGRRILLVILLMLFTLLPAQGFEHIDVYIQDAMQKNRIPGFALSVILDGEIAYSNGYGISNPSQDQVTADTPFLIASLSKSFTAVAIMQLVERQLIDLDEPVVTYLPYFKLDGEDEGKDITVRQLLNHTSGIDNNSEYSVASLRGDDTTIEQFVRNLGKIKPTAPPGESHQYNNANYSILGAIIEQVSKFSYGEYVQKNILDPLNMNHTFTDEQSANINGMAVGYRTVFGFPVAADLPYRTDFLPGYSIVSSANDLAIYCAMLLNRGEYGTSRILSKESVDLMWTPSAEVASEVFYGFGWYVTSGSVYHGGETTNYQTKIKFLPEDDMAVIMLYNTSPSTLTTLFNFSYRDRIESAIINILYGLSPDFIPPGAGILDLNRYPAIITFSLYLLLAIAIAYRIIRLMIQVTKYDRYLRFLRRVSLCHVCIRTIIIHVLIPSAILICIPLATKQPWNAIIFYLPDIGLLMASVCIILLVTGIFKCHAIRKYHRETKVATWP